jgi:hypothetical protein
MTVHLLRFDTEACITQLFWTSSSVTMTGLSNAHFFVQAVLAGVFLIAAFAVRTDGQCSSDDLAPYSQCINQNSPCPCGDCDAEPTDGSPMLTTPVPTDCTDVVRLFCPLVRCCSMCETEAKQWFQKCSADPFSQMWLGSTCELDCSSLPYGDICQPTDAPIFSPTGSPTVYSTTATPSTQVPTTLSPTTTPSASRRKTASPINQPVAAPAVSSASWGDHRILQAGAIFICVSFEFL